MLISAFPPWQKRRFCHFLYFRRGGNVDFADFCISAVAETSFFAFFTHPKPRKRHFSHFPLIRGLGNSVFRIFHSSEASETLFFSFFAHPRPRTDKKPRNLALTTRRKTENPDRRLAENNRPRAFGRCGAWGRERFLQKKCQNKSACVPVSMRCKISRRSSCNQISSQSTSDTFLEQAAKACGIFYLIHVPAPFISEAVPSMYKGH